MMKVICTALYQGGYNSIFRMVMLLTLSFSALGQPLSQSAEMFACGKNYCPRWGYYTCIPSEGGDYCLSCDHDQLEGHCSTPREYPGCNLYCTDKATTAAIEYLNENHTRSTMTLTNKLNASSQEASNLRSQNEALLKEKILAESQLTVLAIVSGVLLLVVTILAAVLLYHCRAILLYPCRRKRKIKRDVENNNMNNLSGMKETSENSFTANTNSTSSTCSVESVNETDNLLEANGSPNQDTSIKNHLTENGNGGCREPKLRNVPVSNEDGKTENAFG